MIPFFSGKRRLRDQNPRSVIKLRLLSLVKRLDEYRFFRRCITDHPDHFRMIRRARDHNTVTPRSRFRRKPLNILDKRTCPVHQLAPFSYQFRFNFRCHAVRTNDNERIVRYLFHTVDDGDASSIKIGNNVFVMDNRSQHDNRTAARLLHEVVRHVDRAANTGAKTGRRRYRDEKITVIRKGA